MRLVELARQRDQIELALIREALADRARAARARAAVAQIDRPEVAGPAGREPDDRLADPDVPVLHLDRAARQQRGLRRDGAGRIEAAHRAPRHRVLVGGGVDEDPAAGGRVEIGEERRHARRAGQQPGDVAIGAGAVVLVERDVAVGVDEGGSLAALVEVEGERHVHLHAVVVAAA